MKPQNDGLEFVTVTAARLLPDGSVDPCSDPQNVGTDYCRTRRPGETPGQWNARRAAELAPGLNVTIRDGNRPMLLQGFNWVPLAAAIAAVLIASRL